MNHDVKKTDCLSGVFRSLIILSLIVFVVILGQHEILFIAISTNSNLLSKLSITINRRNLYCYERGSGFTPLHRAVEKGNISLVKFIISKGVDANQRSEKIIEEKMHSYSTPLHLAAIGAHREVIDYLLSNGANPNLHDHIGYTPLHFAAMNGDEETIRLLIKGGANVKSVSNYGSSPLDVAVTYKNKRAVEILSENMSKEDP